MKFEAKNPKFITSAVDAKGYPDLKNLKGEKLPEVALVGRSNVGKSSLINFLFNHGKMAKVSSLPGKTRLVNFFTLDEAVGFVDLPGYGFAKAPKEERMKWGEMIGDYFAHRKELKLIIFLFDIRRSPTEEDTELMNWMRDSSKSILLVFTKCDKVNAREEKKRKEEIESAFGAPTLPSVSVSATKKTGRELLIKKIQEGLHG